MYYIPKMRIFTKKIILKPLEMILEFSITNYRSIREKQLFTMYASGAKSKSNNTFEVGLNNGVN